MDCNNDYFVQAESMEWKLLDSLDRVFRGVSRHAF